MLVRWSSIALDPSGRPLTGRFSAEGASAAIMNIHPKTKRRLGALIGKAIALPLVGGSASGFYGFLARHGADRTPSSTSSTRKEMQAFVDKDYDTAYKKAFGCMSANEATIRRRFWHWDIPAAKCQASTEIMSPSRSTFIANIVR